MEPPALLKHQDEWFEAGWVILCEYLAKHAAFTEYIEEHMANNLDITDAKQGRVKLRIDSKGKSAMSTTRDARELIQQIADAMGYGVTISIPNTAQRPIGGEQPPEPSLRTES